MSWQPLGRDHTLMTSQWDAVYEVVQGKGFDPAEFVRSRTRGRVFGGIVPVLIHGPTSSEFIFDFDSEEYLSAPQWSPGDQRPTDETDYADWPTVLQIVGLWLENVEREQSSPNLWAMLDQQRELLAASGPTGEVENSPFNPDERAQIATQLNEIKQLLVQTHGADPNALESRVEYLIEASGRMGRKDWLNIFVGTIFGWALTGLVPPEGAREVLAFASHTLGHLFGGAVPQLPMP